MIVLSRTHTQPIRPRETIEVARTEREIYILSYEHSDGNTDIGLALLT